jgi:hypothetical protein
MDILLDHSGFEFQGCLSRPLFDWGFLDIDRPLIDAL